MNNFQPEMLSVQFIPPTFVTQPIIQRRYTLTHSDATGQLFLTIGADYAWNNITAMRDEVLGEWRRSKHQYFFYTSVHIDEGQFNRQTSARRYEIFRRELPLALTAIKYGDQLFFKLHPDLFQSPIIIKFASVYPEFSVQENWGSFAQIATP